MADKWTCVKCKRGFNDLDDFDSGGSESGLCCPDCGCESFLSEVGHDKQFVDADKITNEQQIMVGLVDLERRMKIVEDQAKGLSDEIDQLRFEVLG